MIKTYSELRRLRTFEERFEYLALGGRVGHETFGRDRYLNQDFYRSAEWKLSRRDAIVRDNGCDLGVPGLEIFDRIIVHHINPITVEDIEMGASCLFDLDNLICTSLATSNALHYGGSTYLMQRPQERRKGDTSLW